MHTHYLKTCLAQQQVIKLHEDNPQGRVHMISSIKQLFLLVLIYFVTNIAVSKQLHFSKVEKGSSYQFNYKWLDHQKQLQQMSFTLDKSVLFDSFRNFRTFKPELAIQYVNKNVAKYLHKNPIANVQINYEKNMGNITVRGNDVKVINNAERKIAELNDQYTEKYLDKNLYHHITTYNSIKTIKPNHVKFATMSADDVKPMKPVILKKVSIKNIRKATDYVLAFVQSIPYSTLESRIDSSGAGFNPPQKLLWENKGDCDSKVTLTASILRSLMPRIKMVLVFIDNHALIGIDVLARVNEVTITLDGTTYLLAEPTGPALLPLGTLNETSELAVTQGQYTAEKILKEVSLEEAD